jgi:serine/threonine protein kinase
VVVSGAASDEKQGSIHPHSHYIMDPAVMRLIAARGGGEATASLAPMIRRQESLPPIKINGRSYVQLSLIKQTATSLVHKACAPRDNTQLDTFGEGERKICAVKKMQLGDDVQANRAREELAILQSLATMPAASKHVVMLLDSELQARELKLVMECGHQDLSNWTPSSSFQMLDALEQAIAALAWMHDVGHVAHLDVKPANFLLFPTMNVKLADFGTATRLGEGDGATLTSEAPFAGTIDYLAPEALGLMSADGQCSASASAATDVWAMGVMIHAMIFVNGRLPFPENGSRDVAAQRRVVSAAPVLSADGFLDVISDVGPPCLELTRACLSPAPSDRPSAAFLLQELKRSCYTAITTAARGPAAAAVSPSPSELPPYSAKYDSTLPPGWERVDRLGGRSYYVDHINRRTTWVAPAVERSPQKELPAVVHQSSSISMLSVASQEEAEALAAVEAPRSSVAPQQPATIRRQVTFQSSHEKLDLLFKVLSFVPLKELFRVRRVCQSWRQRIDGAHGKGREWWEVCVAHIPAMTSLGYDQTVDWKEILYVGSLLAPMTSASALLSSTADADRSVIVTAEWMTLSLSNLRRAAVIAACSGALFKNFVSLRTGIFPWCCELMYKAFTQKPPNNQCALAYDWWRSSTPEIAAEITAALKNEPLQRREAAVVSFDSYIKRMAAVLGYLDRFHTERLTLPKLAAVATPVQAQLRADLEVSAPVDVA